MASYDGKGHSPRPSPLLEDALPASDIERILDPRSVVVGRLSGLLLLVAVGAPAAAGLAAAALALSWPLGLEVVLLVGYIGLGGLGATWCYVWPAWRYRTTRYRVDAGGFTIRRGVCWRSVTSVPMNRIQHTDILQGPLQRRFELATLVVYTAGTQNASVSLSGLAHVDAVPLRDALLAAGSETGA